MAAHVGHALCLLLATVAPVSVALQETLCIVDDISGIVVDGEDGLVAPRSRKARVFTEALNELGH